MTPASGGRAYDRSGVNMGMLLRSLGATGAIALVACTVAGTDNDPFGAASTPSTSVTTTLTSTTASTDESSSSGDGESSGAASTSESSGGAELESSSGGVEPDTGSSGGESSGGGGDGTQPADGMYSACANAMDCGVVPALCITIMDMMNNPLGGFCSETGCANPAVTCDPSPGGTATPICMPVQVNGVDGQACALDCSDGKTCPAPMQCLPLASGMICA